MPNRQICKGRFSEEVIKLLRKDHEGSGLAFLSQPCDTCGKKVVAENKAGQWIPATHDAPRPDKRNPSDKSGFYKR